MTMLTHLKTLFVENRRRLSITYGLVLAENFARLFYPIVTGHAINTLLAGRFDGKVGMGTWRRVYDTKTFTRIYANVATGVVAEQHSSEVPLSKIIARANLSKEFVDFFERDTPLMVNTAIALVGFYHHLV